MIKDKFKLLQEINALESDILQDDDYTKIYYLVDDAGRNKGSLNLIARPYISELSILSRFLSEKYKSCESLRVTSQNVKRNTLKEIINGSQLSYMNTLVNTSKVRVLSTELKNEDRMNLFLDILNRVSNTKIGNTVR